MAFLQERAHGRAGREGRPEPDAKIEHAPPQDPPDARDSERKSQLKTGPKQGGGEAVVLRGEVFTRAASDAATAAEAVPIGGVTIVLVTRHHGKREEVIARATSAEDGSFVCASRRPCVLARVGRKKHSERIFVRASAAGWLPAEKRCSLSDGDWKARIELVPGILVHGRVVDALGGPLACATVGIDGLRSPAAEPATEEPTIPWQVDHGRTDGEGCFALGVLGAGHYSLLVEKNDAGRVELEFDVLPQDRALELPDVVLASQASLTGVLTTSSGVPLPGVLIRAELVREKLPEATNELALPAAGLVSAHATTDQQGRFEIDGLLPGNYSLVADCNVGSVRRKTLDAPPALHEMTHLAEAPLAVGSDAPGTAYAADGAELVLVLDACLLEIELQARGRAGDKELWIGVVESPNSIETIHPQQLSLVELRGKEQRATIRSTPGAEAIVIVARGNRGAGHKLDTLATQRVPVSALPGVQRVAIDLR